MAECGQERTTFQNFEFPGLEHLSTRHGLWRYNERPIKSATSMERCEHFNRYSKTMVACTQSPDCHFWEEQGGSGFVALSLTTVRRIV